MLSSNFPVYICKACLCYPFNFSKSFGYMNPFLISKRSRNASNVFSESMTLGYIQSVVPNQGWFCSCHVVIWQCPGAFLAVITEGGGEVLQASNRNNPAELLNILQRTSQPSTYTPIQRITQLKVSIVSRLRNTDRQNKWFRSVIQMKIISL